MKKIKIQNPDAKLVTLCKLRDAVEAELVKNMLFDHGIDSHIDGEFQAGFTGTLDIEIMVLEGDAEKAEEFVRIHHPHVLGEKPADE